MGGQVAVNAGVDVAAACAHDETFDGGEAHAGIDGFAVSDGGDGRAVAEVGDDHAQIFQRFAQNPRGFGGNVAHAGAVEAVAAEGVFFAQFARHGVGVGAFGHGLVERGVHHADVGQAGEVFLRGEDAADVGGVVQRGKRDAGFQLVEDVLVDEDGLVIFFAAVGDAVADGFDAVVQAVFFQFVQQHTHCAGVAVAAGQGNLAFVAVFVEGDDGFGRGQAFAETA